MRVKNLVVGAGLMLGLVGCAGKDFGVEETGEAVAELKLAPQGVLCVTIQVQGSATVTKQFDVSPSSSTTLNLSGLPIGTDSFVAKAYSVPCAQIASASPTFVSNTATAAVATTTPAAVTLTMQAQSTSGSANVGVDFPATALRNQVTYFNATSGADLGDMTTGPDGNLWFTEGMANKIGRITPAGTITEYPLPNANSYPTHITAGPDGNLWFTEGGSAAARIGRITPDGAVTEFVVCVPGSSIEGITAGPDGNLWFTEYSRNKVGRISPAGSITEFAIPTTTGAPLGISAGSDGNIWFTEQEANKIVRMSPVGVTTEFGGLGTQTGGLSSYPSSMTAGADGNLWFVGVNKVGRITTAGVLTEFPVADLSGHLTSTRGPDGNVWFAGRGYLGRVTPAGVITEMPVPTIYAEQPQGMTAGPDGNVWFIMRQANTIGRLSL